MKILIDIVHPAHVHFFKYIIRALERNQDKIIVISRKKTITEKLLDEENISYISLGGYRNNLDKILKTIPIIIRLVLILKKNKFNKNDLIIGISPVQASISSLFVKSSVISFTDTDFAPEQFYLCSFLSKFVFTPNWFPLKVYGAKQIKYRGCQEYNYLNSAYFKPRKEIIEKYGLEEGEYVITRLIKWDATHDIGQRGISDVDNFLNILSQFYDFLITSEYPINDKWKNKVYNGKLCDFHHLLYFSKGYIGEAFTTAQEALILGKPSVLINPIKCRLFENFNSTNNMLCKKTNNYIEAIDIFKQLVNLDDKIKRKMTENYTNNFVDLNQFLLKFFKSLEIEK